MSSYILEGDLRREVALNKQLVEMGCYRGLRHKFTCKRSDLKN